MSQFAVLVNAHDNGVGNVQAAERWSLVHQVRGPRDFVETHYLLDFFDL